MYEKDYIWSPITSGCVIGKCLQSIIHDSVITCDEFIEMTKSVTTKIFQQKLFQQKLFKQKLFQQKLFQKIFSVQINFL